MRAGLRIVILAIIALFTTVLRAPSLLTLDLGQDGGAELSAYRTPAQPALSPARHGRAFEAARKAPLLAVLPSCPALLPSFSVCTSQSSFVELVYTLPILPRSSRGPPART